MSLSEMTPIGDRRPLTTTRRWTCSSRHPPSRFFERRLTWDRLRRRGHEVADHESVPPRRREDRSPRPNEVGLTDHTDQSTRYVDDGQAGDLETCQQVGDLLDRIIFKHHDGGSGHDACHGRAADRSPYLASLAPIPAVLCRTRQTRRWLKPARVEPDGRGPSGPIRGAYRPITDEPVRHGRAEWPGWVTFATPTAVLRRPGCASTGPHGPDEAHRAEVVTMTRVLVVHHDLDLAGQEADSLRRFGYDVVECGGADQEPLPSACRTAVRPRGASRCARLRRVGERRR